MGPPTPLLESPSDLGSERKHLKLKQLLGCFFLWRHGEKHTLKPPILWSFLNSFPFLYQRREGTGFPITWHRNFTVLLAGTAWSCFSIFSGDNHRGANAGKWGQHHDYIHFCLRLIFFPTQKWGNKETGRKKTLAYTGVFHCLLTAHWTACFLLRRTHHLLHLQRILLHRRKQKSDI